MSFPIIMSISAKMLGIIGGSLKIEAISHSRTLLEPKHCPDYFTIREIAGVNQYVYGSITYEIKGRPCEIISDGFAIILPPGASIRHKNLNPGKTISVWHSIRYSIMDTIDLLSLLEMPSALGRSDSAKVGNINKQLEETDAEKYVNFLKYVVRRHELGIQLLNIILGVSTLKAGAENSIQKTERVLPALNYIQKNFTKKICVDELAKMISLSPPQFFNVFRDATGMSPGKYLQLQRMRKAQELLLMQTDVRICEVAGKTGFGDQFHFSRLFKKNFGVSPELFREQFFGRGRGK